MSEHRETCEQAANGDERNTRRKRPHQVLPLRPTDYRSARLKHEQVHMNNRVLSLEFVGEVEERLDFRRRRVVGEKEDLGILISCEGCAYLDGAKSKIMPREMPDNFRRAHPPSPIPSLKRNAYAVQIRISEKLPDRACLELVRGEATLIMTLLHPHIILRAFNFCTDACHYDPSWPRPSEQSHCHSHLAPLPSHS